MGEAEQGLRAQDTQVRPERKRAPSLERTVVSSLVGVYGNNNLSSLEPEVRDLLGIEEGVIESQSLISFLSGGHLQTFEEYSHRPAAEKLALLRTVRTRIKGKDLPSLFELPSNPLGWVPLEAMEALGKKMGDQEGLLTALAKGEKTADFLEVLQTEFPDGFPASRLKDISGRQASDAKVQAAQEAISNGKDAQSTETIGQFGWGIKQALEYLSPGQGTIKVITQTSGGDILVKEVKKGYDGEVYERFRKPTPKESDVISSPSGTLLEISEVRLSKRLQEDIIAQTRERFIFSQGTAIRVNGEKVNHTGEEVTEIRGRIPPVGQNHIDLTVTDTSLSILDNGSGMAPLGLFGMFYPHSSKGMRLIAESQVGEYVSEHGRVYTYHAKDARHAIVFLRNGEAIEPVMPIPKLEQRNTDSVQGIDLSVGLTVSQGRRGFEVNESFSQAVIQIVDEVTRSEIDNGEKLDILSGIIAAVRAQGQNASGEMRLDATGEQVRKILREIVDKSQYTIGYLLSYDYVLLPNRPEYQKIKGEKVLYLDPILLRSSQKTDALLERQGFARLRSPDGVIARDGWSVYAGVMAKDQTLDRILALPSASDMILALKKQEGNILPLVVDAKNKIAIIDTNLWQVLQNAVGEEKELLRALIELRLNPIDTGYSQKPGEKRIQLVFVPKGVEMFAGSNETAIARLPEELAKLVMHGYPTQALTLEDGRIVTLTWEGEFRQFYPDGRITEEKIAEMEEFGQVHEFNTAEGIVFLGTKQDYECVAYVMDLKGQITRHPLPNFSEDWRNFSSLVANVQFYQGKPGELLYTVPNIDEHYIDFHGTRVFSLPLTPGAEPTLLGTYDFAELIGKKYLNGLKQVGITPEGNVFFIAKAEMEQADFVEEFKREYQKQSDSLDALYQTFLSDEDLSDIKIKEDADIDDGDYGFKPINNEGLYFYHILPNGRVEKLFLARNKSVSNIGVTYQDLMYLSIIADGTIRVLPVLTDPLRVYRDEERRMDGSWVPYYTPPFSYTQRGQILNQIDRRIFPFDLAQRTFLPEVRLPLEAMIDKKGELVAEYIEAVHSIFQAGEQYESAFSALLYTDLSAQELGQRIQVVKSEKFQKAVRESWEAYTKEQNALDQSSEISRGLSNFLSAINIILSVEPQELTPQILEFFYLMPGGSLHDISMQDIRDIAEALGGLEDFAERKLLVEKPIYQVAGIMTDEAQRKVIWQNLGILVRGRHKDDFLRVVQTENTGAAIADPASAPIVSRARAYALFLTGQIRPLRIESQEATSAPSHELFSEEIPLTLLIHMRKHMGILTLPEMAKTIQQFGGVQAMLHSGIDFSDAKQDLLLAIWGGSVDEGIIVGRELTQNARDAIASLGESGGEITVDAYLKSNGELVLPFSDTGKGMSLKEIVSFLIPGVSHKPSAVGQKGFFGLGLFPAYRHAEALEVVTTSWEEGKLKTFAMTLQTTAEDSGKVNGVTVTSIREYENPLQEKPGTKIRIIRKPDGDLPELEGSLFVASVLAGGAALLTNPQIAGIPLSFQLVNEYGEKHHLTAESQVIASFNLQSKTGARLLFARAKDAPSQMTDSGLPMSALTANGYLDLVPPSLRDLYTKGNISAVISGTGLPLTIDRAFIVGSEHIEGVKRIIVTQSLTMAARETGTTSYTIPGAPDDLLSNKRYWVAQGKSLPPLYNEHAKTISDKINNHQVLSHEDIAFISQNTKSLLQVLVGITWVEDGRHISLADKAASIHEAASHSGEAIRRQFGVTSLPDKATQVPDMSYVQMARAGEVKITPRDGISFEKFSQLSDTERNLIAQAKKILGLREIYFVPDRIMSNVAGRYTSGENVVYLKKGLLSGPAEKRIEVLIHELAHAAEAVLLGVSQDFDLNESFTHQQEGGLFPDFYRVFTTLFMRRLQNLLSSPTS